MTLGCLEKTQWTVGGRSIERTMPQKEILYKYKDANKYTKFREERQEQQKTI